MYRARTAAGSGDSELEPESEPVADDDSKTKKKKKGKKKKDSDDIDLADRVKGGCSTTDHMSAGSDTDIGNRGYERFESSDDDDAIEDYLCYNGHNLNAHSATEHYDTSDDDDDDDADDGQYDDDNDGKCDQHGHTYEPETASEIARVVLQNHWPTCEELQVKANLANGRWILDEVGAAFEGEELKQTVHRNLSNPDFGCGWMNEQSPGTETSLHCQPCGPANNLIPEEPLQLSGRIQGSARNRMLAGETTQHVLQTGVLGGVARYVTDRIDKANRHLAREGLVLAFVADKPRPSPLGTQYAEKVRRRTQHDSLALSARIKGDGDGPDESEGVEGEGGEEDAEAMEVELSEEDKAILAGDIKGIDPALLKAQSNNSVVVKKYRAVGELLLEKSSMKINPKGFKAQKAKELFAGVVADLIYSRVSLALDPGISETIEKIKYTPEGEDVALVLPTFMKNLLQNAVDDLLEGQVREQVEKLVMAAIGMAAKLFTKALPGLPGSGDDNDDDDDDGDDDDDDKEETKAGGDEGEGGAEGQNDAEEDGGIGSASHGAAAAALATGGVAAAIGITVATGEEAPKILKVLDEDTLGMVLYSMVSLTPLIKKYAKTAKKAQSEWFSLGGKDEIKANNRANKRRKKGSRIKVRIPIYKFHKAGLAVATESMLKKMKKKDKEALEKAGVVLEVPSDELPASEYRVAVETIMAAWVVVIAKKSCGSDIEKKVSKLKGLNKSEKKELTADVYEKVTEVLHKETAKILKDAYDEVAFKLVVPGTKPTKESGEKSDGDDIGACKQCGKKLRTYGNDHPCYAEFGNLDEWDCDVCGKSFGKEDVLYCCDTFEACDWGACVKCQVLIKPSAVDVESEADKKKAAKEVAKQQKKQAKEAKKQKKKKDTNEWSTNPLAEGDDLGDLEDLDVEQVGAQKKKKSQKDKKKKKKGKDEASATFANPVAHEPDEADQV